MIVAYLEKAVSTLVDKANFDRPLGLVAGVCTGVFDAGF